VVQPVDGMEVLMELCLLRLDVVQGHLRQLVEHKLVVEFMELMVI
jgi:hypothetical protein